VLEHEGEPPAPDEGAVDGEAGAVAEVEDVEEAFLGLVGLERLALERGLEVVEEDRSLADGEDAELREGFSPVGDAVAAAEETPVVYAPEVLVHPEATVLAGGEA
jgi:hypothetical protein